MNKKINLWMLLSCFTLGTSVMPANEMENHSVAGEYLQALIDQEILKSLKPGAFVLEKDEVEVLERVEKVSVETLLGHLVDIGRPFARPSISKFHVGAAALGESGAIYLGVNLEFLGVPLHQTVHAEQFAINLARSHGEKSITMMAVSAAPCGHCRQFMQEMDEKGSLTLLISGSEKTTLAELLPKAFGPRDLGLDGNMMTPPATDYVLTMDYSLPTLAYQAALHSYAPYSLSKAGVAIQTYDGAIYSGSYLETAAFNPSMPPLQAALVALVADHRDYSEIKAVLLVERQSATISHEAISRELLKGIAPTALFQCRKIDF